VLVANTLLIDTNTLNCKNAVFLAQPTSVKLVVGHSEEENNADDSSQQSSQKEHDLPAFNGSRMRLRSLRDSIRHKTTKDLRKAIE
jgi:hypothetical protein